MSDVTAHWSQSALGDLFDLARLPILPSAFPDEKFAHYSIPAWDEHRGPAIEAGAAIGSAKIAIAQPTILVSKLNPRIPRVVHLEADNGLRRCASTEFIPYVAKSDSVVLRFYRWFFESHLFQRRLERIATGSTNSHKRARPGETLGWSVPSPLPDDQKSVAAVLDTVDEAIAKTEAVIAKLRQVRAGLLHDLLTYGLDKNGQLRDPIAHPEQFQDSPLGQIPKDWDIVPLKAKCEMFAGGTPSRNCSELFGGEIPWVKSGEVNQDAIMGTEESLTYEGLASSNAKWIPEGTPLIAMYGATAGQVSWLAIRATSNQAVLAIVPRDAETVARFVFWAVRNASPRLVSLATGSGQPNLSKGMIEDILMAFPKGAAEQNAIAAYIDGIIDSERSEDANLNKLHHLKSGLMTDLLTGRVRVPEILQPRV